MPHKEFLRSGLTVGLRLALFAAGARLVFMYAESVSHKNITMAGLQLIALAATTSAILLLGGKKENTEIKK